MSWLRDIWTYGSWSVRLSLIYWVCLIAIAILAPLIAHKGGLVPFGPNDLAPDFAFYQPPGTADSQGTHLLGTNALGHDVLARMIYGTRTALLIGLGASILSLAVALLFGILSGYLSNDRYRINRWQLIFSLVYYPLMLFFCLEMPLFGSTWISIIVWLSIGIALSRLIGRTARDITIPLDTLVIKFIEIFTTVPGLLLVLSLFAIIGETGILAVIVILGLISWPGKARLLRAEIMNQKSQSYVKAAEMMGLPWHRVLGTHILPNAIQPLLIALVFSFAGTILIESTLSFLNLGLPITVASWGGLMRDARDYFSAWWLAFFPGLLLFTTVLTLNIIADRLSEQ